MFELLVVVDLDQEILDSFKKFLELHGYRVVGASHGTEAARQLQLGRPDLIVIEPALSEDWGQRLLEQYRCCASGVPIIAVSKSSRCNLPFPFRAYHVKPVSLFQLLASIRASLPITS